MLKIYICDDNPGHLASIKKHVENHAAMSDVAMEIACADTAPTALLERLESSPGGAGLYFLDYHLNCESMDGIHLAEKIRKVDPRGFIVFITSDAAAHRLTFKHKVEALDYIVKDDPYLKERIVECMDDAAEKYTAKASALQDNSVFKLSEDVKRLFGGTRLAKDSKVSIENNKILCFMTEPDIKHTVIVYTTDGRIQFSGSLKQVEANMDKERFYRCQNNMIVSLDKILALDPVQSIVVLEGNNTFTISSRQYKKLDERWVEYKQKKK